MGLEPLEVPRAWPWRPHRAMASLQREQGRDWYGPEFSEALTVVEDTAASSGLKAAGQMGGDALHRGEWTLPEKETR